MTKTDIETYNNVDACLHDADRAVGGYEMAAMMGDRGSAAALRQKAIDLYARAEAIDPAHDDPAWQEMGNRDRDWLRRNGFASIADIRGRY